MRTPKHPSKRSMIKYIQMRKKVREDRASGTPSVMDGQSRGMTKPDVDRFRARDRLCVTPSSQLHKPDRTSDCVALLPGCPRGELRFFAASSTNTRADASAKCSSSNFGVFYSRWHLQYHKPPKHLLVLLHNSKFCKHAHNFFKTSPRYFVIN